MARWSAEVLPSWTGRLSTQQSTAVRGCRNSGLSRVYVGHQSACLGGAAACNLKYHLSMNAGTGSPSGAGEHCWAVDERNTGNLRVSLRATHRYAADLSGSPNAGW
jgi:hypothetical protein